MDILPSEIRRSIASFLDNKTARVVRICSREWFKITDYSHFTIFFARKSTLPQIIDRLATYNRPIGLHFQKNVDLDGPALINNVSRLTQLTSLGVHQTLLAADEEQWLALTCLTNLHDLDLHCDAPHALLAHLPRLTSAWISLEEDSCLPRQWPQLRSLVVHEISNVNEVLDRVTDQLTALTFKDVLEPDDHTSYRRFTNLRTLTHWGALGTILDLTGITSLESLATDAAALVGCENNNVTALCLRVTEDFKIESIRALTRIEALEIFGPAPSQIYSAFSRLTRLAVKFATAVDLSSVTARLKNLQLSAENVNYDSLTHLTNLEHVAVLERMEQAVEPLINRPPYGAYLNSFSRLRSLELNSTHAQTAPVCHLSILSNLVHLKISNFDVSAIDLATATNLQSLTIQRMKMTDEHWQCLSKMTHLTSLMARLGMEGVSNLTFLDNLAKLRQLSLSLKGMVHETADWTPFEQLTALESLRLNSVMTDDILLHLTGLVRLTHLIFSASCLPFAELTRLTNLQQLSTRQLPEDVVNRFKEKMPFFFSHSGFVPLDE